MAPRTALAALIAALWIPASASAEPVSAPDVLRLSESGAGESLIRDLVDADGFAGPLGIDEVVAMKEAGLSDGIIAWLRSVLPRQEPEGVSFEHDGEVLVVSGMGEAVEDEAGAPADVEPRGAEPVASRDATAEVVALAAAALELAQRGVEAAPAPPAADNPYPVGATFGWSGGAVFLPARFGERPSSFGRTIVGFSEAGCGPVLPPVSLHPPLVEVPEPRTVPLRTSRGVIQLPN